MTAPAVSRTAIPGFGGEVLEPADAGYDGARRVFNGLIDRRPDVIPGVRGVGEAVEQQDERAIAPGERGEARAVRFDHEVGADRTVDARRDVSAIERVRGLL